jgi:hypothetical protein
MLLPAFYSFFIDKTEGLSLGLQVSDNGLPAHVDDYVFTLRIFTEVTNEPLFSIDAVKTSDTEVLFVEPVIAIPDQRAQYEITALRLADNCARVIVEGHCSIY